MIKNYLNQAGLVSLRMASQAIIIKIIAQSISSDQFVMVGQFNNIFQIFNNFVNGCIGNCLTNKKSKSINNKLTFCNSVAAWFVKLFLYLFLIFGLLIPFEVSLFGFDSSLYAALYISLVCQIIFIDRVTTFQASFDSRKNLYYQAPVIIISSLFNTILVFFYGFYGALLCTALYLSSGIVLIGPRSFFYYLYGSIVKKIFFLDVYKEIKPYLIMFFFSSICGPVAMIMIRGRLIENFGSYEASMWEVSVRLSSYYIAGITSVFSFSVMPMYAKCLSKDCLNKKLKKIFLIIFLCGALSSTLLYLLSDFIVLLMFSKSYLGAMDIYNLYIIGDFFRMCSWSVAIAFIAIGDYRKMIISELSFSLLLICLVFLLRYDKIYFVGYFYILTNAFYLFVCLFLFFRIKLR